MYQITKLGDLVIIIDHFNLYPLLTQKYADFLLFKKAFDIIKDKKHLTIEGLHDLISIRASLNKGLFERLKLAFPNIKPVVRPALPLWTLMDHYGPLWTLREGDLIYPKNLIIQILTIGLQVLFQLFFYSYK